MARMTGRPNDRLRVALIPGALDALGGAQKQSVYMARALKRAEVDVRVYSFTGAGRFEEVLRDEGIPHRLIQCRRNPISRMRTLHSDVRSFCPHIIQAGLLSLNIHVSILARLIGSIAIGAVRSSGFRDVEVSGRRGPWLLRMPPNLIANSYAAKRNLESLGIPPVKIAVLPNVIDLADFDDRASRTAWPQDDGGRIVAIAVGRLMPVKRFDLFLEALAKARLSTPALTGLIVGDGPEQTALEGKAGELGLLPDGVAFLGLRDDIPSCLGRADMLVLTSDIEGFPNVLLEAMAARLPVITTPAGEAGDIVEDGTTGYVVPFDDVDGIAERMVRLAGSLSLRRQLGALARRRAEQLYHFETLADRLLSIYEDIAVQRRSHEALRLISYLTNNRSTQRTLVESQVRP